MFTEIRHASSRVSRCIAMRRPRRTRAARVIPISARSRSLSVISFVAGANAANAFDEITFHLTPTRQPAARTEERLPAGTKVTGVT
jgi:hypothetical protein